MAPLPGLISFSGIICSTGLAGSILIVLTIIRYTLYLIVTAFFFPLPLILVCYTTSIPRQRVMRFARMALALISVFVISTAAFHVILMNLLASQPTLTFYMSYYICLSYTSSVNPFLYILLRGNAQKDLRQCTNVEDEMIEKNFNITEYTLKSSF